MQKLNQQNKIYLNNLPEIYEFPNGSILVINDYKNNQIVEKKYIYVTSNEIGHIFYSINEGIIVYYDELLEKYNKNNINKIIKETGIKPYVIIPEAKDLLKNYLNGIVIYNIILLEEPFIHERTIKINIKVIELINKMLKTFN